MLQMDIYSPHENKLHSVKLLIMLNNAVKVSILHIPPSNHKPHIHYCVVNRVEPLGEREREITENNLQVFFPFLHRTNKFPIYIFQFI